VTLSLALACGEVPWERELLEAVGQSAGFSMARRYVDVDTLARDAGSGGLGGVVLMSPAVRGFDAKPVLAVAASGAYVVVLLDTIRPPWLATSGLDCRERGEVHFATLLDELVRYAGSDAPEPAGGATRGAVTVFAGVGGGVGVSTLAWIDALRRPDALLVDAHVTHPSLGFLCGADADSATLLRSIAELSRDPDARLQDHVVAQRVLTLPLAGAEGFGEREATMLVDAAAEQYAEVVLDAGDLAGAVVSDGLWDRVQRLVLVTTAAPMGLVRLPGAIDTVRRDGLEINVVVNRFRESVASSSRAKSAIRGLVERSCGLTPMFVDEDSASFDHAWLRGDWQLVEQVVPRFGS
jgi:hypothetical protein